MSQDGAKPFVKAAAWIRAGLPRHLSPTAVRVLLVIVAHVDKSGRAWPSAGRIGELTGHSRTRIYRALQELERIGFLQRHSQGRARFRETNHPGPVVYAVRELDSTAAARLAKEVLRRSGWGEALRFKRSSQDVPAHETSQPNRDVPRLETSHHREVSQDGSRKMSQDGTQEMSQVDHRDVSSRGSQDVSALETQKGFKGVKEQRGKAMGFGKGVQGETLLPTQDGGKRLSPQTPLSRSLSLGPEKPKSTAREKTVGPEQVADYLSRIAVEDWEKHITLLLRQGYEPRVIDQGRDMARGSIKGKGTTESHKPLLTARQRIKRKGLCVRKMA